MIQTSVVPDTLKNSYNNFFKSGLTNDTGILNYRTIAVLPFIIKIEKFTANRLHTHCLGTDILVILNSGSNTQKLFNKMIFNKYRSLDSREFAVAIFLELINTSIKGKKNWDWCFLNLITNYLNSRRQMVTH